MKRVLFLILACSAIVSAQTHTQVTIEDNQTITGNKTHTGTETFSGPIVNTGTDSGNQTITGNKTFTSFLTLPLTTSSTVGPINLGTFRFIHNYPGTTFPSNTGQNTYVGVNAGNFTMGKSPLWQPLTVYRLGQGGTANSSGTTITWTGQNQFITGTTWNGATIYFNQTPYIIASVTDATHLVLTTSAGTQTAQPYFVQTSAVTDPSGHTQYVTTGGTSPIRLLFPTWNDAGGSTTDGTVTWKDGGNGPAGAYNTAIGELALANCTTCWVEVAVGQSALYSDTSGQDNTGVGGTALFSNMNGYQNTAMGFDSLFLNNHGFGNSAYGSNTLVNSTGNYNSAAGFDALYDLNGLTSSANAAFGVNAGYNSGGPILSAVSNSCFFGPYATSSIATLANSCAIGYQATVNASNQMVLGNASITDIYFGSTSSAATIHAANSAVAGISYFNVLQSLTANPAAASTIRLANTDHIGWRNSGNTADHILGEVQHIRGTAGCSTGAALNNACTTTITWPSTFADTNYTAICEGKSTFTGTPVLQGEVTASRTAAVIVVQTINLSAIISSFATIDCEAWHD